ncbi:MAG: hypothetical protein P8Y97_17590 [Candidatus Lokiarchaeota archaeon]
MIKDIMKLYSISREEAKELIQKERERYNYCISENQAMIYLINKKKTKSDSL